MSDEPESPIYSHYLAYGGAAGILGIPTSDEEDVTGAGTVPGKRRHFRGTLYGAMHGISLRTPADKVPGSCQQPDEFGTPVESTIAWSTETGAHAVHGEIRALWLELGAEGGSLGYPISDELPTPDGRGRRSQFQFGEIWWQPGTGATTRRAD